MISDAYAWLGRHRRTFLVPAALLLLLVVAETYVQIRFGASAVPGPVILYAIMLAVVTLTLVGIALAWKTAEHVSAVMTGQLAELNVVRMEPPREQSPSRARDRFLQSVPDVPAWAGNATDHGTLYGGPVAVEQGPPPVLDGWAGFVRGYSTTTAEEPHRTDPDDTQGIGQAS